MDEAQKLAIAERLRELDKRSPWTQQQIADKLHIRLRSYQKMLKEGTTKRARCVEMARIHSKWANGSPDYPHLSADWIWDGRMPEEAPDLLGRMDPVDQMLDKLDAVLTRLETTEADRVDDRDALQRRLDEIEALIKQRASGD